MYEYKCVTVVLKTSFKCRRGDGFKECMGQIHQHARDGWRLVQILDLIRERPNYALAYEIIFEKEIPDTK